MSRVERALGIFLTATLLLLFSISPVIAEESGGLADSISGTADATANASEDNTESVGNTAMSADPSFGTDDGIADSSTGSSEVIQDAARSAGDKETANDQSDGNVNAGAENIRENSDLTTTVEEVAELAPAAAEPTPVTSPEFVLESETPPEAAEQPKANDTQYLDNAVLNVVVPISISITIDPLEMAGKGQIYSNIYDIKNEGVNDVLLTFTNIHVDFADNMNFLAMNQPFGDEQATPLKSIYMQLDFERSDIPDEIITDTTTDKAIVIPLSATASNTTDTSSLQFIFSGCVNYAPAAAWMDNDVKIRMNYTLQTVPPPAPVEEIVDSALEEAAPSTAPDVSLQDPTELEVTDAEAQTASADPEDSDSVQLNQNSSGGSETSGSPPESDLSEPDSSGASDSPDSSDSSAHSDSNASESAGDSDTGSETGTE